MDADITQALKDTENSLRDFIGSILEGKLGLDWAAKSGVSEDRLKHWKDRKAIEEKRQVGGVVEPRLIYYADFYDIKTILNKHWDKFSDALGDLKTIKVYLDELEKLRDPDAHRRELLPHQKNLAVGIAGEIRTRLIRYRSQIETKESYFPRIECARDSLGNIWLAGSNSPCFTKHLLRPGDIVDFVVTASDPVGAALEYRIGASYGFPTPWKRDNQLSITILPSDIGKTFVVRLEIKSSRSYHAQGTTDDDAEFYYAVLPAKGAT